MGLSGAFDPKWEAQHTCLSLVLVPVSRCAKKLVTKQHRKLVKHTDWPASIYLLSVPSTRRHPRFQTVPGWSPRFPARRANDRALVVSVLFRGPPNAFLSWGSTRVDPLGQMSLRRACLKDGLSWGLGTLEVCDIAKGNWTTRCAAISKVIWRSSVLL